MTECGGDNCSNWLMRVRSPCGIGFANGVVDAVSPVIGAAWPALDKSTELAVVIVTVIKSAF
ncbi:hypothetical protein Hdeb2414_s0007g00244691 [Helianthus debilis subsp. tardiflorus]